MSESRRSKPIKKRDYEAGDEPVPGYRLVEFLGRGGFGQVWKADASGGAQVVLKFISLDTGQGFKELRALRLVKKVRQANLVPIFSFWLKDQAGDFVEEADIDPNLASRSIRETMMPRDSVRPAELIIAMGLGDKNLLERLEECEATGQHGIPTKELMTYMRDAARAIDYLNTPQHEIGSTQIAIQHCDIKPQNMLIVGNAVQICDFGLARVLGDIRKTTVAGSIPYTAPEYLESNAPSPATDQYALAISYVELRTGELPFPEGAGPATVINAHMNTQLDLSRLPEAEQAVIRRATARQPSSRFASSTDMVAALEEVVSGSKVEPTRKPWLRWIAAAVLLLTTGGIIAAFTIPSRPKPRAWLPDGFVAAPGAKLIEDGGRGYYDRLICQRNGVSIPFRFVRRQRSADPPSFYMMENKVWNDVFRHFVDTNPDDFRDSQWTLGGIKAPHDAGPDANPDLGTGAAMGRLPVLRVTCIEANRFARWLGCALPTAGQWDMAAGRNEPIAARGEGPYRGHWDSKQPLQIAVARHEVGPLDVGTAADDETIFGCRDMAANGQEWTLTPLDASTKIDADNIAPSDVVCLRGCSYTESAPLRFADLDDPDQTKNSWDCGEVLPYLGFRLVFDQLPP